MLAKQYYNRDDAAIDKSSYYQLFSERLGGGVAVFSSTLNDYGFSGEPLGEDGLVSLRGLAVRAPRRKGTRR